MRIYNDINSLKDILIQKKFKGKKIGLVPTMGALHEGHISLIEAANTECDITVCSIYVNPTQFNNASDLENYPKSLDDDLKMLSEVGCDIVFTPDNDLMYSSESNLSLGFANLEEVMEGEFRPRHFSGVGLVVSKLFNIVQPTHAYFGQKDLQQCAVIKQLVKELMFDIEIRIVPITREASGLAMSSRNRRLSEKGTSQAQIFSKSLASSCIDLKKGISPSDVKNKIKRNFAASNIKLEYFEIVDLDTLQSLDAIDNPAKAALCIAGYIEGVRLIDNMILE